MRKTKANISLFELMKIPQIQENFTKYMQGKASYGTKEINLGTKKGTTKLSYYNNNTPHKVQVVTNAFLTRLLGMCYILCMCVCGHVRYDNCV
jgi:hypothetical protein